MEVECEGQQVNLWLRLPHPLLKSLDLNSNGRLEEDEIQSEVIQKAIESKIGVTGDSGPGKLEILPARFGPPDWTHTNLSLRWTFPEPPKELRFHFDYFVESKDKPRCLASFVHKDRTTSFVFERGRTEFELSSQDSSFFSFVLVGGEHILEGYDHILFLLVLLLSGGGLLNVFKMVTAFTVAHSITLGLAVLGYFTLPGWFVEPVIVLSIAVAAIENIRSERVDNRWLVAGGFGLIHGMGFAGLLADMQLSGWSALWPLVGFNVGVELGQAIIVVMVYPVLYWISKREWARRFTVVGSGLSALTALFWFAQVMAPGT